MLYQIPGQGGLEINTIILDLNGTISVGGEIVEGVEERTKKLKELGLNLILLTGNTRGYADTIANKLDIEWLQASSAKEKRKRALGLNPATCASIGNGLIDIELMQTVRLGIATLQAEGVHIQTLLACDLVVPSINDALDLFIEEERLIASLRK